MTAAFWAMMRAVSSMQDRDDFLGKDHCEAATILTPLEKPDKISVDDLGVLLQRFAHFSERLLPHCEANLGDVSSQMCLLLPHAATTEMEMPLRGQNLVPRKSSCHR